MRKLIPKSSDPPPENRECLLYNPSIKSISRITNLIYLEILFNTF